MVSERREELEREGWERKTVIDEPRLSELAALYESLGFEVLLEPLVPDDEECSACMAADPDRFKTIYVRRRH